MNEIEINTNLFYEELNSTCNPEKLLNIAKKKKKKVLYSPLYKYEKIKYNEIILDISYISNQYYMIFNDSQYKRIVHFLTKTNNHVFISKIIINKYFMDKIMNEKDHNIINLFFNNLFKYFGNKTTDYIIK